MTAQREVWQTIRVQTPDDINVKWLVTLRWGATVGQVALLSAAAWLLDLTFSWWPVALIVGLEVATNRIAPSWPRPTCCL